MLLVGRRRSACSKTAGSKSPSSLKKEIRTTALGTPSVTFTYFNMDGPGRRRLSNAQVALVARSRWALTSANSFASSSTDNALPANQLLPPASTVTDGGGAPRSLDDPSRARGAPRLLSDQGNTDGDGYREGPDGKPLTGRARNAARIVVPRSPTRCGRRNMANGDQHPDADQPAERSLSSEPGPRRQAARCSIWATGQLALPATRYCRRLEQGEARHQPVGLQLSSNDAAYEEFVRTPLARTNGASRARCRSCRRRGC